MERLKYIANILIAILPWRLQLLIKRLTAKTIMNGPAAGLRFSARDITESYINGTYEKPLQNKITSLLHSGDVFYDIGANFGFFSLIAAKLVNRTGQVYAFEPVPKNVAVICLNACLNNFKHIKVIDRAVSDKDGTQEVWITQHPGGATLTSTGVVPSDKVSKLVVETAAIDTLISRGKLPPPSLIKIDVEGAELQVLKGMSRMLKNYTPVVIYEIDDHDDKSFQLKIEQIQSFLMMFGYSIHRLDDSYPLSGSYVAHFVASV